MTGGKGARRWFILSAGAIINICLGICYAFSVFQQPLMDKYGWSGTQTALAFTLIMSVSAVPMPFAGKLLKLAQPRALLAFSGVVHGICLYAAGFANSAAAFCLLFGVGCGIFQGIIYSVVTTNTIKMFPDRRGLCSGILAGGLGCGALLWAPLANVFIERVGVGGAFHILGATDASVIILMSLFIPAANNSESENNSTGLSWHKMLRTKAFWWIAAMFLCGTINGTMVIAHASALLQRMGGFSPSSAASLVGVISLCNAAGRLAWGAASDRAGRLPVCAVLCVLSAGSALQLSTGNLTVPSVLIIGFCYGGFMSQIAALTADTFGPRGFPVNFGIMFLAYAAAALIGPRLLAILAESSGSYTAALILGAMFGLAGLAVIGFGKKPIRQMILSNFSNF